MATRSKTREISVIDEGGAFSIFFKKFAGETESYNFEGVEILRNLLTNEKARILHTIKTKNPESIYGLAKLLQRDFKSVREDIKTLERFGFIDMISEKSGKRERLKPLLVVDNIIVNFKI